METSQADLTRRRRQRWVLLGVALLFAAPVIAALWLRAIDWRPGATRNFGELLDPPVSIADVTLRERDGDAYVWDDPDRIWRVLVLPPDECGARCAELLDLLDRVWQTQGRHADRAHVVWAGALPDGAQEFEALHVVDAPATLSQRLPGGVAGTLGVYLVDPRGFVALRYPQGFDPSGLRKDWARMLR